MTTQSNMFGLGGSTVHDQVRQVYMNDTPNSPRDLLFQWAKHVYPDDSKEKIKNILTAERVARKLFKEN